MVPSTIVIVSARNAFGPLVYNLLFYGTEEEAKTDFKTRPGTIAGASIEPVIVTQFGSQSGGFWYMVVAGQNDPTSFSPSLALQYFPDTRYLNFVNPTFIQDLETLTVSGFFSNGIPGP